ncbi:MAG: TolC family protein [Ignavibacteriae bacterium]|nr:TolC family protein [Ignavibacteriota bacterium]
MSRSPVSTQWFCVLLLAASSAFAQIQTANPDSALQLILESIQGTPLSLHDAVQSALSNATSVRTAEAAYVAAQGSRRREAGYFDPELFFTFNRFDGKTPTATFFAGAPVLTTRQDSLNGSLRWTLPTGTSLSLSLNTIKLETNSSFASLNPQYTSFGFAAVRQSLLGGFIVSARKNLERADQGQQAAKARYDQEVLATGTLVEQSYWDLYAAERDYAVQKLTRDRAEVFLKDTETRARAGLIGPNQVANARTFLAEQEIFLLDREELLDRLSDQVASLIGKRPEAGMTRFISVDDPPAEFPEEQPEKLVEEAVEKNLTLQAAQADIEAQRALADAAFWEALPQVDFVGSLGGNGLTGVPQDVFFNGQPLPRSTRSGSLGDALRSAVKREFPTWSVGIQVSVPIGLRSGLGELERLEAEVAIVEQRRIQLARVLEEQVRSSYRELFNGTRRLTAAREGVAAAQEQVRIGLIEFRNGRTTAFELVRLSADFAVAQQRYSIALVRGAKAAANLRQLTSGAYPPAQ